jgi:hypothetical protein
MIVFFFVYLIPMLITVITNIKVHYVVCRKDDVCVSQRFHFYALKIHHHGRHAFNFNVPHARRRRRAERQIGRTIVLVVGKLPLIRIS